MPVLCRDFKHWHSSTHGLCYTFNSAHEFKMKEEGSEESSESGEDEGSGFDQAMGAGPLVRTTRSFGPKVWKLILFLDL